MAASRVPHVSVLHLGAALAISCLSRTLVRSIQLSQHERFAPPPKRAHPDPVGALKAMLDKPGTNLHRINTYTSTSEQKALTAIMHLTQNSRLCSLASWTKSKSR
jgi:hypothetical protein